MKRLAYNSTFKKWRSWHSVRSSQQIDGETIVTDFILGEEGFKITANGDCIHEIKECLLLGRKAMTNLDSVLKTETLLCQQVCLVKATVFPVVMCGYESWTIKKTERPRIDAFELRCWRRLLRVPWNAKRSNQSILKEISPEYSLEGLMLKLKLQSFGHLMLRTDSMKRRWCWERLKAGGEGDDRGWDGWMASPTQWTWVWVNSGVGDGQGGLVCYSPWGRKELDMAERLNWTEGAQILRRKWSLGIWGWGLQESFSEVFRIWGWGFQVRVQEKRSCWVRTWFIYALMEW